MIISEKNAMNSLLIKVAKRMTTIGQGQMNESCPISIIDFNQWEWAQGVGLYGLYHYYKVSGDNTYLDYLVKWYDDKIAQSLPEKNINTCAPMLTLAFIYESEKKEVYLKLIEEWANWIMTELPRTEEDGFQHIVSGHANKEQLWIDTLFMAVLFLAKAGVLLGRKEYIEESKYQFLIHIKYLYDKKSRLWFHGWNFTHRDNFSNALWGRGNCWYTVGVVDYIDILSMEDGGFKRYLLDTLLAQVKALIALQEPDGMWHTLITDKTSYVETSATAGFAYGILRAVKRGYIDPSFKECGLKASNAVMQRIDEDGTVLEVSYGTAIGETLKAYKNIPICPMTYGQGLAILCISAALDL